MAGAFFESAGCDSMESQTPKEQRFPGVALALVIDNKDIDGEGRVQVQLPWLPNLNPWARVALPMAGTWLIPQKGDEVLVAFNQGDVREPIVIGSLWNAIDRLPVTNRLIRSPSGHKILFDDQSGAVIIQNSAGQTLGLNSQAVEINAVEINAGTAPPPVKSRIKLDSDGSITIESLSPDGSITLNAPRVVVKGSNIEISGTTSVKVDGGFNCTVKAAQVDIN